MMELTVKQAIEQGYTKYGFANKEWQYLNDLHDDVFSEVDEDDWDDLVLTEKKSNQPTIDGKRIANMLADYIADDDSNVSGRDDDSVYNTVESIDFTDVANMVNKHLEQHKYWILTDIKLIPAT